MEVDITIEVVEATEVNQLVPFEWFKGDTKTFRFTLVESGTTNPVDITDWPIAAEIWDGAGQFARKATANIVGGADEQVLVTEPTLGIFEVYFLAADTTDFAQDAGIEVAEYSSSGKRTLYRKSMKFLTPKIDWAVLL